MAASHPKVRSLQQSPHQQQQTYQAVVRQLLLLPPLLLEVTWRWQQPCPVQSLGQVCGTGLLPTQQLQQQQLAGCLQLQPGLHLLLLACLHTQLLLLLVL